MINENNDHSNNIKLILSKLNDGEAGEYETYKEVGRYIKSLADISDWPAHIDTAFARRPQTRTAYLGLADGLARAGMGERTRPPHLPQTAIEVLQRGLRDTTPTDSAAALHCNLSFLYNEIGEYAAGERHGRAADGNANHIYHLWLAEALFAQNKFSGDPLCVIDFSTLRTDLLQQSANRASEEWGVNGQTNSGKYTILQSVDAVYFKKFAVPQVLSAYRYNKNVRFHFHIINPDAECADLLRMLRQRLPGIVLDASQESRDTGAPSSDRVYYACARLMIARKIMEKTGGDIVIADADILFRADPDALSAEAAGYDLAGVQYPGEPMCNRYNASFFVIRRTLPSLMFLHMLEQFLLSNFRRAYLWMIDQVALYCCERRQAAVTQGAVRMLRWPETVVSIHQSPQSPIWSGATAAKWGLTPYTRYQEELLRDFGSTPAA